MPILKNVRSWVGGYDLTTDLNQVGLDLDHEVQDDTRFQPVGSGGARARVCGLEDVSASFTGFHAAPVDANAFAGWNGGLDEPWTIANDGVEGNAAYIMRGGRFKYTLGDQVGNNHKISLDVKGMNGETAVARGLVTKTVGTVAATGATGTGVQLGAVGAGQYLYCALHVFSVGTTITAVLESAPTNAFGANTTRITFGPITTVGGVWGARVAGPITDTWYRLRVTAVTGSFSIAAVPAIK
ncbi:hypothetical protein AB0M54_24320 [Actinoplanes sp. NPDC051470]|uniref:hypothetical protein n=1 Tax=Actinoplanes sp. NPDC051470 TaxID=3157224 RepID=UPI0034436B1E